MSLSDINPQIDPGSDVGNKTIISPSHPSQSGSTQSNIQANATAVKDAVVNSEVRTVMLQIRLNANIDSTVPNSLTSSCLITPSDASAAVNAVKDHPVTQNVVNGPVAQSVKAEAAQTSDEFGGLVNSRQTPAGKAANGQSLTNYHSFFYTLLSVCHKPCDGTRTMLTITVETPTCHWYHLRYINCLHLCLQIFTSPQVGLEDVMDGLGR